MVHTSGRCSEYKLATVYLVTRLALLELATIPVLLRPEKVSGSCSVCVKAAVWCACGACDICSYHQIRVQWMSVHVAGTQQ